MLFYVRQKHQDLLTQLAVSIQNYLAIDIVIKNNIELIKGVDRASTTTVSALRTAVIVAQALGNQKLVLDQITALNTTTSGDDRAHLARCCATTRCAIQQQAASATIGLPQLQAAFAEHLRDDGRDRHLQGRRPWTPWPPRSARWRPRSSKSRDYLERVAAAGPARGHRVPRPRPARRNPALGLHAGDTGTWRLHGRRPASSGDSSGDGPSRSARRSTLPPRPDQPRTCSRRSPGSRRWSPAGAVPRLVASRVTPGRPDRPRHHPAAADARRGQPAGLLGDGDRDRLPARGGRRLPAPAAASSPTAGRSTGARPR